MLMRLDSSALAGLGNTVARELASAIESCTAALRADDVAAVARALRARGLVESDCTTLIDQVSRNPATANQVVELRTSLGVDNNENEVLERCLLLHAVSRYGVMMPRRSLSESVLRCLTDELRFLAAPSPSDSAQLLAPSHGFVSMAKIVTLRRFTAGQLHIERAAIPRSWLIRLGPRSFARVLVFLARHGRARGPFFFHHVAWRRKNRLMLLENEQNRSYFRIAQLLELHPEVKGLIAESWLHSPDTYRVSPHLAWLNRPFQEYGGLVTVIGRASESSGVFSGSAARKRLYDEGRFRPTTAMAIWPRAALLDWALRHPEFGDCTL